MLVNGDLKVGDVVVVSATQEPHNYANGASVEVTRVNKAEHSRIFSGTVRGGDSYLFYYDEVSWPAGAQGSFEAVSHPAHYGGDTTYEAIKVIEAWGLGFNTGNATKYISRAGKKDKSKELEDINKAIWYLQREAAKLEEASA